MIIYSVNEIIKIYECVEVRAVLLEMVDPFILNITRHRASTSMYSLTFRVRRYTVMCMDCKSARRIVVISIIANPPNSAQLGGTPTIPPSYIRVRAVVWECGRGQTHTDARDQYTFCVVYDARKM